MFNSSEALSVNSSTSNKEVLVSVEPKGVNEQAGLYEISKKSKSIFLNKRSIFLLTTLVVFSFVYLSGFYKQFSFKVFNKSIPLDYNSMSLVNDDESIDQFFSFVKIPYGVFSRDSTSGTDTRAIDITEAFEIGKYEVTEAQWFLIMQKNPSPYNLEDGLPIVSVSWIHVKDFINALNILSKKYNYRLPTEAEWEYACKEKHKEIDSISLYQTAWYSANSDGLTHTIRETLGSKKPNRWGLYNMKGNVWEWCNDWFSDDYYRYFIERTNPQGPSYGDRRVIKGGSFMGDNKSCQCSFRSMAPPHLAYHNIGFRLIRTLKYTNQ